MLLCRGHGRFLTSSRLHDLWFRPKWKAELADEGGKQLRNMSMWFLVRPFSLILPHTKTTVTFCNLSGNKSPPIPIPPDGLETAWNLDPHKFAQVWQQIQIACLHVHIWMHRFKQCAFSRAEGKLAGCSPLNMKSYISYINNGCNCDWEVKCFEKDKVSDFFTN